VSTLAINRSTSPRRALREAVLSLLLLVPAWYVIAWFLDGRDLPALWLVGIFAVGWVVMAQIGAAIARWWGRRSG
jgi:hypothetical protein